MFSKSYPLFIALIILAALELVTAREVILERNGRALVLYPRRFGQEQPAVLQKLRDACPGEICGTLAGQAVTPLLAAQPECTQQDMADAIIDASKQFDATTQTNMIAIAIEYRQVEKNTPPDFSTNPPALRNSVFCQKAPKNPELNGLIQAQDPANDPNLFFDPATSATVKKGDQPNTSPFGGAGASPSANPVSSSAGVSATLSATPSGPKSTGIALLDSQPESCVTAITVTVTVTNSAATNTNAVTVSVGSPSSATVTISSSTATVTASPSGADFGSCSTPQIEFGVGFDGRKETSFEPVDKQSFNHGSAQNINIITQFVCDQLTNTCKANQAAKDLCNKAKAAASAATAGTGEQADAFNGVFGISTDFGSVISVDNQGRPVAGTGSSDSAQNSASTTQLSNTLVVSPTSSAPATSNTAANIISGIGDFGSCSTPEIRFGTGFDGRKETSFEPVDQTSFNHGSAQNIGIITQFICDTLTNTCDADQAAKDTCAIAQSAATAAAAGTGAQADAFNAAFGTKTNFADVTQIDNQGNPVVGGTAVAATATATTETSRITPSTITTQPPATSSSAPAAASNDVNLQTFTGALGGVTAPAVIALDNGKFQVEGNSVINDQTGALTRSCDVQHNQCADAANASKNQGGFTVAACDAQNTQCKAA